MTDGPGHVGPGEPPSPEGESAARATVVKKPRKPDPWAHRRGEPRLFVFGWTLFLFAATVSTFVAAQRAGVADRSIVRGAARLLVLAATVGVVVLWPMVRLSQWPDPRPVRGTFRDLVVLLVPLQAMLWPLAMPWLAHWPLPVVGAVDLLLFSWAALIGGVLALAQAMRLRAWRLGAPWGGAPTAWAMLIVLLTAGLGAVGAAMPAPNPLGAPDVRPPEFRLGWMLSPVTAVFEITRDRTWSGLTARVTPFHTLTLLFTAAAALPVWFVAARLERGLKAPSRLH
jgi:hypothetical protein